MEGWLVGLAVSGLFGGLAYRLGTMDGRGVVVGILLGATIYGGLGPAGFGLLALFFVLGSGATRLGRGAKERRRVAQSQRGARTVRHALANGLVAAVAALGAALRPDFAEPLRLAFAGSLAAATADTLSSEIGQAYGGRPRLFLTFRPVPVGENGGVTPIGTLAGVVGTVLVGLAASGSGLAPDPYRIALAGVVGNAIDSVLGATLERRGLLNNAEVNLLCTLTGGVTAAALLLL